MPATLEEMASKGRSKLRDKADSMKSAWNAMTEHMKDAYDKLPFGPTRKANYKKAIDSAKTEGRYRVDPDKWYDKWKAKMAI
jgi:hypothetical protein